METRKDQEDLKKRRETPIIDGDARPDQPVGDEPKRDPNVTAIKDEEKTTTNRVDTDSQDDFRDAKL